MKREYTKPQVMIENYFLSESVASCAEVSYYVSTNTMTISDAVAALNAASSLFVSECGVDVSKHPEALDGTGFCYHGPVESVQGASFAFNS